MKLSIAILALAAATANAGDWSLQVHGTSHHFQPRNDGLRWNESNPGVGIRYAVTDKWAVQVGRYKNSYSLPGYEAYTNYVSVDYMPLRHKAASAGFYGGGGTGYDEPLWVFVNGFPVVTRVETRPIVLSAGLIGRLNFGKFNITLRTNPGMAAVEYGVAF